MCKLSPEPSTALLMGEFYPRSKADATPAEPLRDARRFLHALPEDSGDGAPSPERRVVFGRPGVQRPPIRVTVTPITGRRSFWWAGHTH